MRKVGRPRLGDEKLIPVSIRLQRESLKQIEAVAATRKWPIGQTVREMVEAALMADLVPPVAEPRPSQKSADVQSMSQCV